ncbi:adenine DNA glycosylase [Alicyclobacillus cellulosilyticus]|uniref:Adenine DNA glycosylase n=1 Tax=Alicyclobacillus cellulosilyticus TaxID=1003997 RepID=A0A917KBH7_9BACL|nr:A/G-specific adenine glycosylase [Alicyclobacillus cellulosilyticus]GGJ05730.1 adenine DNA glycosylase [Alicyclobacillus cellulosilyticus]
MPHPAQVLVAWYRAHHRRLPWRQTRDPYAILVSETMLQQTRVETVVPYYERFLRRFPTVRDLAAAAEDEVLKLWQGLGYYRRARHLHRAAQAVVADYGGAFPPSPAAIARLPGVGPYTVGAVCSIAWDLPVPAVDGNVLRVMARYLALAEPVDRAPVKRRIADEVRVWLACARPSELTQALMELGAVVCTPRSPRCGECPLAPTCAARVQGRAEELPVRAEKRPRRRVEVAALWLEHDRRILVERRPAQGLLAGMWQLPQVEREAGARDRQRLARDTADLARLYAELTGDPGVLRDGGFVPVAEARHVFTHLEWDVVVYRPADPVREPLSAVREGTWARGADGGFADIPAAGPRRQWIAFADVPRLAWPRVYERLLARLVP